MSPEVILVDLINYQEYIHDNIKNLKHIGNDNITVITNETLVNVFEKIPEVTNIISAESLDDHHMNSFDKHNKYHKERRYKIRNGFWSHASKRFFYLYNYIKKFDKTGVFHIENDVMVYHHLSKLIPKKNKLFVTMDSNERCVPGFMYIPNHKSMESLINNWNNNKKDMINIGRFCNDNPNI